jgi:penicillin amidase
MTNLTPERLRAALPDTSATLSLAGLEHPVTIHRDRHGIAHVRAGTEHDAFLAQGFVHAQDRLWQMEYDRLRAAGRWSELVGAEGLAQDRQLRRFQIGRTLQQDYDALKPATRAMLDAYSDGVNAFLATTERLPVEFELVGARPEPWRATDCLAVFKVRHIMMGVWEGKVWRAKLLERLGPERLARFVPGYPPGQLVMVPPGGRFEGPVLDGVRELSGAMTHLAAMQEAMDAGSNNWVAGGARTQSGLPLMAGDPHRAMEVPNVYYQNHVACDAFDVIGFSFPGLPGFPHFAHNEHVAWCITHGQADYQDIYIEAFDPDDPTRYRFRDEWREAEHRRETIAVKDGEPVELEVWHTHHGPIVAGDPRSGSALAFRYTAMERPNRTLDAVHGMLSARDADALEASQEAWVDPVNNLLYCDVHGAFGYRTRGELPLRPIANGWLPVPGWSGEHEWEGRVPYAEMPAVRDPETGYAYSANNRITDAG